jgi:hypothetical protein
MSGISPIGALPVPTAAFENSQSSPLATDKATAKSAEVAAMEAALQLLAAQSPQAAAAVIKADQRTVTADDRAVVTADAQVKADENGSTGLNILV